VKLRRRLRFECEPSSYEGIGHLSALHPWTSSSAYGREIDADGRDIENNWQEPDDGCEWLTLVGAADEQAKSRLEARCVKLPTFSAPVQLVVASCRRWTSPWRGTPTARRSASSIA
jgi:hypothetical protein